MAQVSTTGFVIVGVVGALAVGMIAVSLRRPEVPSFPPSPIAALAADSAALGERVYTIDASDSEQWRYFDFSSGTRVERPQPLGWDLAFRRFNILVNGGDGFAGQGGVLDLGEVSFDSVSTLPSAGYEGTTANRDSVVAPLRRWYRYSFTSHLLKPLPRVYAVRTADGGHAKVEILSYYCPGAQPGCVTIRYLYQPSAAAAPPPSPPASPR